MIRLLMRFWIPLVIIVIVVIASLTVMRVRTFFGSDSGPGYGGTVFEDTEPFNPKVVKYEIWGDGTYADVNYLDLDAEPQRADGVALPWELTLESTAPSVFPLVVAQGDSSNLFCRITVDDEVKDERSTSGVSAQTFCLVKSA